MGDTKIEWTDTTWNPVSGCTRVSSGCDSCYAVTMTHRLEAMGSAKYAGLTVLNGKGERHFNGVVRTHEASLMEPFHWRKPRKVFVNSMSDLFHRDVPINFIDRVFAVMALTPHHTYQILTKRPERMGEYLSFTQDRKVASPPRRIGMQMAEVGRELPVSRHFVVERVEGVPRWPLPNVWLGTSVENQKAADERIPHLLRCQAAVRFLSVEPMLGAVDLSGITVEGDGGPERIHPLEGTGIIGQSPYTVPIGTQINWVIVGGESGRGARPCDVQWIRSIILQCQAAGTACFVKQLGAKPYDSTQRISIDGPDSHAIELLMDDKKGGDPSEWSADLRVREFPWKGSSERNHDDD